MTNTVAKHIAATLAAAGIDRFFLLTGGDQPLWIALEEAGIDQVLARSEASAVYMADAYAQTTGRVAVVYGQAGPGAANIAAALADPYWSKTPVLSITGGTATSAERRTEYQELQTSGMFDAVTTTNVTLTDPDRIVDLLPRLIALAQTSGPVNLTVPKNLFAAPVRETAGISIPVVEDRIHPDPAGVSRAVDQITSFERPLILAGTGAKRAEVGELVLRLAERLGAPIALSPGGKGVVDERQEQVVGVIGRYASTAANRIAEECDGLIVLGSRAGGLVTDGYRFSDPGHGVVHLDRDPDALLGQVGGGIRLQTDLRSGLEALLEQLDGEGSGPATAWLTHAQHARSDWRATVEDLPATGPSGDLAPHALFPHLNRVADRICVVADTGYMAAWSATLFEPQGVGGFLRANGSLGWALPAALGAQLGSDGRRVVCVTGDGGLGYHVGDLETAVRRGLAPIVLVLNNRSLAFEYHEQKYKWEGRVIPIVNDLSDIDHAQVAAAFGWAGHRVNDLASFTAGLDEALEDTSRPWLLDVIVDKDEFAPVTNFDRFLERRI